MTIHMWLLFALALFCMGLYATLVRRNLIAILIGIELMLNAASINFMAFNKFVASDPVVGQIIVLFIIGLAAAEVAIALSIVLAVYREHANIDVSDLEELKG
ncbi:MAG: NADH-quinone oxidoreductase subunit NuoK [Phycisphaerales bacterium]|nr:NADH-quinone oxidoreductase subunit NuoK [Phycisphaerales bacterium]